MPDKFAQLINIDVTESAANTQTTQQLLTGAGLFDRRALIIHRIQYEWLPATLNLILDGSDWITAAVLTNNQLDLTNADVGQNASLVDRTRWAAADFGTPASASLYDPTQVHDFTTMPGGGLIIPAYPIYGAIIGTSLASVATTHIRMWYTLLELKPDEYIELVEASRIIS